MIVHLLCLIISSTPCAPQHSPIYPQEPQFPQSLGNGQFYPEPRLEDPVEDPVISAHGKTTQADDIALAIMEGYKKYERPPGINATEVTVNMKVVALFSIDVRTMDYKMDILLRQSWVDSRLAWKNNPMFEGYNDTLVSPSWKEKLWLPDLFFRNGKKGYLHKLTMPNYMLRVHPDGLVLYSQKITMTFSCQMHLQTFPMDSQECHMDIGSYGYEVSEVNFVWAAEKPVELPETLEISEFETPKEFITQDCSKNFGTSTGKYTCLNATFILERQLGSYLATTYIPNILIIMVSWLSFWVNVDSAPARVPLGLLSLLGILTQAISVSGTLPRVSYIKAIDIWMIFSIIFVIGVLVEYAVALTVLRRRHVESWHQDIKEIVHQELARWCAVCQYEQIQNQAPGQMAFCDQVEAMLTEQLIAENKPTSGMSTKFSPSSTFHLPPQLIESGVDNYSQFLFPACFILYNCFYWSYYLIMVK